MASSSQNLLDKPKKRRGSGISRRWLDLFALIPGYDPVATAAPGEWFDEETADNAVAFFPGYLEFIEGERAGQPFELEPWQAAGVGCAFGWKREGQKSNGEKIVVRRYREVFDFEPRKNGKSPKVAGIVCLVMFTDGESGAQLYSAAAEREQAALVYRHAAGMIARNPELAERCKVYRTYKSIEHRATASVYKALSADAETKHGFNSHFVAVDELHAHPNGDLVDVLTTSTGTRTQPLIWHITTADYARDSICNRKYDYACKVRDGVIKDSSFLPMIWEASVDDDWTDPKVWEKANPNLGVSVKREYLERECKRAQEEPSYENTFKRLHLNIRTQQDIRWLQLEPWGKCGSKIDVAALAGRTCFGAIDLSTKFDISSFCLCFPPAEDDEPWKFLWRHWIPSENAEKREKRDRVPYLTWARQGFITLTPGSVIDYDFIKEAIGEDARTYDIREIAYDTWNATQIALQLGDSGATMVEFGQGFKSMSEPAKELEKMIVSQQMSHGDNPVLNWMASHVAVEMDAAGNIKPSKKKSTERIDGIVTAVMALGRAMVNESGPNPYDTRGVIYL